MVALYVTSLEGAAGKTSICAGLGKHLVDDGKRVAFIKPVVAGDEDPAVANTGGDAAFVKRVLALDDPLENICPVVSAHDKLPDKIKEAYSKVSRDKDVVIIESGWGQGQSYYEIVKALDARAIIVGDYSKEIDEARLINNGKGLGGHLLGVVANKVPRSKVDYISNHLSAQLGEAGTNVLAVLPEDRILSTLTIGELAEHIQGEILNCVDKSAELLENFMLGAMYVDSGLEYFGRKANKAVVVRGDRPDIQLAALETSTRCLVLSGNMTPIHAVLHGAKDKGIPIVLARGDTMATVVAIENALDEVRFGQEKKLSRLIEIMERLFNFQVAYGELSLAD